jgi:hypothetical protein
MGWRNKMVDETAIIRRPSSPGVSDIQHQGYSPDQLNPDLAAAAMAREIVAKLPKPAIISKLFAVRQGIFTALNNSPTNLTGYDCSVRLLVYDAVAETSVNIEGKYFNSLWAYLMKPKYIIQGMPQQMGGFEEEKPGILSRVVGWFRGGNKQEDNKA